MNNVELWLFAHLNAGAGTPIWRIHVASLNNERTSHNDALDCGGPWVGFNPCEGLCYGPL